MLTYDVSGCPVPLRGSSSMNVPKSAREGTTFSMPAIAMCSGGNVVVMRILPSLSTSMSEPLSAAIRFAPEMPASAAMNCSRSFSRANFVSSSPVSSGRSVVNLRLNSAVMRSRE